jgi:hypothetical protein
VRTEIQLNIKQCKYFAFMVQQTIIFKYASHLLYELYYLVNTKLENKWACEIIKRKATIN